MSAETVYQDATAYPDPIDIINWQQHSACAPSNWSTYVPEIPHDPETFFPKRLEGGQCAPAKALCFHCPVREFCLMEGLREPSGVWGGLSEKERRVAQMMNRKGATAKEILTYFDGQPAKRRRRTTRSIEAAALTSTVIEQFLDITGTLPVGAVEDGSVEGDLDPLGPSVEVRREAERRKNGLR